MVILEKQAMDKPNVRFTGHALDALASALQEAACQVNEDHQGRFRKLQAESLPRLVSLALFLSGNCGLPRSIFSTGRTDGQRFAASEMKARRGL